MTEEHSELNGNSRDRQKEETRRKVFESALEIFRRDGVHACRIDDIVKLAGVSRGTFYFHFPTKDDVLIAVLEETEGAVARQVESLPPDMTVRGILATVSDALATIWEAESELLPDVATVGVRLGALSIYSRERSPLRQVLSERFEVASSRNELTSILPAPIMADIYLVNTLGGMLSWYANRTLALSEVLKNVSLIFLDGAGSFHLGTTL